MKNEQLRVNNERLLFGHTAARREGRAVLRDRRSLLIIHCSLFIVLAGCPAPLGLEYLSRSGRVVVAGEDLSGFVPAPVAEAAPVPSFAAASYTGTVAWKDRNGGAVTDFQAGAEYQAVVTLKAASGYTFEGVPAVSEAGSFSHSRSREVIHGAGTGTTLEVTIRFYPAAKAGTGGDGFDPVVTDYDLQHYVPVPVTGAVPVTGIARPDLSGAVQWQDANGTDIEAPPSFVEGAVYRAVITLSAREPYRFDTTFPFSYPAGTVQSPPDPGILDAGERKLSVTYWPTAAPKPVSSPIDLAAYIPAPAAGATPVTSFSAGTFGGTVTWTVTGGAGHSGLFKAGTAYTAAVTLYAAPGYTLAGVSVIYNGSGGTVNASTAWTNNGSSLTGLEVSFPATKKAVVDDLILTYRVTKPVTGGTPVTYFSAPQYTGTVAWEPAHGTFRLGESYTAKATLIPVEGYTFDGISGPFSHGEAADMPAPNPSYNGNGTVTVTIAFGPAADAIMVPSITLTDLVPAPVMDRTPVRSFFTSEYTGTVSWSGTMKGDLFGADVVYTATVTVTPAPGYAFPDSLQVTHGAISGILNFTAPPADANSRQGTITFPKTADKSKVNADRFSGDAGVDPDSAIDQIREAKNANIQTLTITLTGGGTEPVTLGKFGEDLPAAGLVLTAAGSNGSVASPANVTINGGGRTVKLNAGDTDPLITVGQGVTLTLRSITLNGNFSISADGLTFDNYAPLIKVETGGHLVLETGAAITENVNVRGNGGGVYVDGGTFTMNGGTISGNISNYRNGGGVYVAGGMFTMTGGTISENKDVPIGWGEVYQTLNGGGVYVAGGTFTMTGGTISGNTAIYAPGNGGGKGGGVYVDSGGTFTMSGGNISGNIASNGYGGGVYVGGGTFTMNSGTTISGNTASSGGGVYVKAGAFTMNGGTIKTNGGAVMVPPINGTTYGPASYGGGVYVDSSGTFTMRAGNIGNVEAEANTAAYNGGGVYVGGGGFTMTGGNIIWNKANGAHPAGKDTGDVYGYGGGGVYVRGGEFTMSGSAVISDNTAEDMGGGVRVDSGTFTMTGGTIGTGNKAKGGGGVYVGSVASTSGVTTFDSGEFVMRGGTISGNKVQYSDPDPLRKTGNGGGVYLGRVMIDSSSRYHVQGFSSDRFTMSGGTIRGNDAAGKGGGVYMESGAFTMSGGTIGSGNKAHGTGGRGVIVGDPYKQAGQATYTGGVDGSGGGGVYVNSGTFTMSGGTIDGNEADGGVDGGKGGGVYAGCAWADDDGYITYAVPGEFIMSGGRISNNKAKNFGGGVYVGYLGTNPKYSVVGTGVFTKVGSAVLYGRNGYNDGEHAGQNLADSGVSYNFQDVSSTFGDAAYVQKDGKYRDTTPAGLALDSGYTGTTPGGGWEGLNPPSP